MYMYCSISTTPVHVPNGVPLSGGEGVTPVTSGGTATRVVAVKEPAVTVRNSDCTAERIRPSSGPRGPVADDEDDVARAPEDDAITDTMATPGSADTAIDDEDIGRDIFRLSPSRQGQTNPTTDTASRSN